MEKKRVNMVLGRFQPITSGHMKIVDELFKQNALPTVFCLVSNKKFDNKHPFSDELISKELEIIEKNYPAIAGRIYVKSANIEWALQDLHKEGFEPLLWGCGTDRYEAYKKQADKYAPRNDALPEFDVYEVKRGDEDISATKVREAIKNDDIETYKKMMPKGTDKIFDEFKDQLNNIKESKKWISLTNYINENLR